MDERVFSELASWVTEAGLIGRTETELMAGFCRRVADTGIPLARALVILDTLHPIYEGRAFRWRDDAPDTIEAVDYGRTNEGEAAENWRRSPFFHLLQSGEQAMRRRLVAGDPADFPIFAQSRDEGATDILVLVHRFAAEGVIGEMDCVYSTWSSGAADGFAEGAVAALKRLAPFLKLAVKSASLARMAGTLAETYLGRDAGQRVMSGRIVRGVAEKIGAVLWYSDLHGYTHISDNAPPEQIIPLLNDYADVVVSAVHGHGGDVLKLIGDGTLAIFHRRRPRTRLSRSACRCGTCAPSRRQAQWKPHRGGFADDPGVSRASRWRRLLRQCGQQGSARLYGNRPGSE
jgi:adenylate cyclase